MPFKKIVRSLKKALGGGSRPKISKLVEGDVKEKFDPSKIMGGRSKFRGVGEAIAGKVGPGDIDSSQKDKKTGAIRLGAGGIKLTPEAIARLKKQEEEDGKKKPSTPAGLKRGGMIAAKSFESGGAVKASSKGRGMGAATQGGGAVGGAAKKKGYAMGGMAMKKGYAMGGPAMKKGYAMGGAAMKKGYASGGSVRGK
jgi:hypothetical protein